MTSRPSGTVTFLFTDIENSTILARQHPETWEAARARHHAILRAAIEKYDGFVFQIIGDAFCAAFHKVADALKASIQAQQDLQNEPWTDFTIYVRMGIHTGEAENDGNEYRGYTTLSLVQRLMSAGHGGQILVSSTTENLLQEQLPRQISLRDMGMQKFAGVPSPLRVFQVIAPDLPSEFPPLRTPENLPNNLPTQLTSFVGREKELAEVKRLLSEWRLATLTGSGGCGKTRLALQVAVNLMDTYNDGVWLIELASLADPALVPQALAAVLSVREQPDQPILTSLVDYLRSKHLLLVLDNCEHLIDACAHLANALLRACPNLRILATSREALNIAGEHAWTVPSLSLPDMGQKILTFTELSQYEAVQLFVDRAVAVQPSFKLTELNAQAVTQVCQRLDGIPLAIELAAARMKVLQSAEIVARWNDRFHLLTAGGRTAMPRHQTLRAAIDWSYDLLSELERALLRRLSVFAGGCTLDAAEQVCADEAGRERISSSQILDLLSQLVDKSLVVVDKQSGETRYRMLETIREYARERLAVSGEEPSIRQRHAKFFTTWVERMAMELRAGPTQLERFAQLEVENDDIGATLEWSLGDADAELGLRLIGAIFYFWWRCDHWTEWERWTTLASAHLEHVSETTRAGTLIAIAVMEYYLRSDIEASGYHCREALTIYRQFGDRRNIAWAILWLGYFWLGIKEKYTECIDLTEEAIALLQQEGDLGAVAVVLNILGQHHAQSYGDLVRAKDSHQEALRIAREIGDQLREVVQLVNLGSIAIDEGDYDNAVMYFKQQLAWAREHRNSAQILAGLAGLSEGLGIRGELERAALLMGAIDMLADNWRIKLQPSAQPRHNRSSALVRGQLGNDAFERLRGKGRTLTLEQTIEYALEGTAPHEKVNTPQISRQMAKQEFSGLTEREREVAAHIAQGESNREISEALVVTERTVESHVTNILNKLGFTRRAQIRKWAVERGLGKITE